MEQLAKTGMNVQLELILAQKTQTVQTQWEVLIAHANKDLFAITPTVLILMNVPMPTDAQVSPPVSTRLVHSYATVVQELLTILRVIPVKI